MSLVLTAELQKLAPRDEDDDTITPRQHISGAMPCHTLNPIEITQTLSEAKAGTLKRLEKFTKDDSGWKLKHCALLYLGIALYQPSRGRSYIKTPAYTPPRTVIYVKSQDNRSFEWALVSATYPVGHGKHSDRPASYQAHFGELNFTDISPPVKVTDIAKFESQNPGLSVNVFGWKHDLYHCIY